MNDLISAPTKTDDDQSGYRLGTGVVSDVSVDGYAVIDVQPRIARRAASCLVEPRVGDAVLVARGDEFIWILAVLVAAGERDVRLQGPALYAQAQRMHLTAGDLRTTSSDWHASHGNVLLTARKLAAQVCILEWLSNRVTACVDMVVGRFRTSLREVSGIDSTACSNYDLKVDETLAMSAKTGVISGQGLMKIDASQIHIG